MTPADDEFDDDDLGDELLLAALAEAEAGGCSSRTPSRPPSVKKPPPVPGTKQTNLSGYITGRPAQQPVQRGQYGKQKTGKQVGRYATAVNPSLIVVAGPAKRELGVPLSYARAQYQSAVHTHNHHEVDTEAAKTWIYPTNCAIRDYQFNIVQKSLLVNTLVALPTGLGKTLIAAVVMYNVRIIAFPGQDPRISLG